MYKKSKFYYENNYVGIVNNLIVNCAERLPGSISSKPKAIVSFLLTKEVFENWLIIQSLVTDSIVYNKIQNFIIIKLEVKECVYEISYRDRILPIPLIGNNENIMKIKLKTYEAKSKLRIRYL